MEILQDFLAFSEYMNFILFFLDIDVAAFAAMITTEGEVSQYLKLDHILKRKTSWNEMERDNKEADMNSLKEFVKDNR